MQHKFLRLFTGLSLCTLFCVTVHAEEVTLKAADSVKVFASLSKAEKPQKDKAICLLFHQAGSNRHEYDMLVPELNNLGFDTLATDQRSGAKRWGHENQTVKTLGKSQSYLEALKDLEAAVKWATSQKYKKIVAVGSSYSAALVFVLAKKHGKHLTGIASFSPGEYFRQSKTFIHDHAKTLTLPIYVTASSSAGEQSQINNILKETKSRKVTRHKPSFGVHGASTTRKDRNPKTWKENLDHFLTYLKSL